MCCVAVTCLSQFVVAGVAGRSAVVAVVAVVVAVSVAAPTNAPADGIVGVLETTVWDRSLGDYWKVWG